MNPRNSSFAKPVAIGVAVVLVLLGLLLLAAILIVGGWHLVFLHLVGGFFFFLKHNLPAVSTNADTWIPGLAAFLIASAIGHFLFRRRAARASRRWPLSNTLCIALLLPVLFTTAFIVPGILLQLGSLRSNPWFNHSGSAGSEIRWQLQFLWMEAIEAADAHPRRQLPESIPEIPDSSAILSRSIRSRQTRLPIEPIIYLGAGSDLSTDGSLPILISAPYKDKGTIMRQVITLDGDIIPIQDSETDAWLNRAKRP